MLVLVTKGPQAGKTLDMCTRQAEAALEGGWAVRPAAEEVPAIPPAEVESAVVDPVAEVADAPAASRPRRGAGR